MKCTGPIMITNPAFEGKKCGSHTQDRTIPVRCGKCEGCLKTNINNWSFRLLIEAKRSTSVAFVTLTYSPEFVPLTDSLLPTLSKTDVQKFFKRLRKSTRNKLRYFVVGEYGSHSYRPHYHLILFNTESRRSIENAWMVQGNPIGNCHIGDSIDNGAIPYTLKYMYKKGLVPAFSEDDRLPEFRMMSKKLGSNYLSKEIIEYHLKDLENRQFVVNNGYKLAMPRYFREKLIEYSGRPKEAFRPKDQSVFMTEDDDDYRTLKSRVDNIKRRQKKFENDRNQINRKKI